MPIANDIPPINAAQTNGAMDDASKAKLRKAAKDFESLFVGYMLKGMRSTIPKSGMEKDDYGGDMMEGMFDMEFAKYVSNSSNLGLGEMLYKKLTGEEMPKMSAHQSYSLPASAVQPAKTAGVPAAAGLSAPPTSVQRRIENYKDSIQAASEKYGVSANLIKAVMASESGGKPNAQSSKNAKGLMQLIDSTAADMGVKNVWNPQQNIDGGAKYLKQMLDKFQGDLPNAVASYNAGAGSCQKAGRGSAD